MYILQPNIDDCFVSVEVGLQQPQRLQGKFAIPCQDPHMR